MPSLALMFVCKQIITSKCRYDVLSTKVEIRLAKAESVHWTSLEFSKENRVPQKVNALGRLIFL
jgi:suppressor of G2 allele of SKP1